MDATEDTASVTNKAEARFSGARENIAVGGGAIAAIGGLASVLAGSLPVAGVALLIGGIATVVKLVDTYHRRRARSTTGVGATASTTAVDQASRG
jgi:hypothetical protein